MPRKKRQPVGEQATYDFLSPGSKVKRSVGFDIKFDEVLQAHYLEERKIAEAMTRKLPGSLSTVTLPTFTDVITELLKQGLIVRKKWMRETWPLLKKAGEPGCPELPKS